MGTKKYHKQFTSKFINSRFLIKVYGYVDGIRINKLLGVSGALALFGDFLYEFVAKAIDRGLDKFVAKLRRGLKVTLYCK